MSDVKEKTASDHRQLWWIPLLCLLVGGALLGIATNLAKFAVEIGLTPLAFLFWSISGAAIILSIVAYMRDEVLAGRIIEAVVGAVDLPVTVKIRLGWDDKTRNAPKLAHMAQEAGVKMIAVHGRTRCQFYTGVADWEAIGQVKNAVSIPLVGNGDVMSEEDGANLLAQSGADGVMVGRGSYGRPWFLRQLAHYLETGEKLPDPGPAERLRFVLAHYDHMLAHYGARRGVRIARKHLGWYSKGLPGSAAFRGLFNGIDEAGRARRAIEDFFQNPSRRVAA